MKTKTNPEVKHLIDFCKKKRKHTLSLILGSGVTRGIVGNWNELLNEVAVSRCAAHSEEITRVPVKPSQLRDYIEGTKSGCFLSDDTDVREKGEYLRFDSSDFNNNEFVEEDRKFTAIFGSTQDSWREKAFARRVLVSIDNLRDRHLADGAEENKRTSVNEDFIAWKNNDPICSEFSDIKRRVVTDNKNCKKELLAHYGNSEDIYSRLKCLYSFSVISPEPIKTMTGVLVKARDWDAGDCDVPDLSNDLTQFFPFKHSSIQRCVERAAKKAVSLSRMRTDVTSILTDMILEITSFALWRPDYGTIDALLDICYRGKVDRIITYNFDTYFDRLLMDDKVRASFKGVGYGPVTVLLYGIHKTNPVSFGPFPAKSPKKRRRISMYHIHGILDDEYKVEPIIFSGTSYSQYEEDYFNRSARLFAKVIDESDDVLCVGFSGMDSNFRKITEQLKAVADSSVFNEHHAQVYLSKTLSDINLRFSPSGDYAKICCKTYTEMVSRYYSSELDTTILWTTDFGTLASDLMEIGKVKSRSKHHIVTGTKT